MNTNPMHAFKIDTFWKSTQTKPNRTKIQSIHRNRLNQIGWIQNSISSAFMRSNAIDWYECVFAYTPSPTLRMSRAAAAALKSSQVMGKMSDNKVNYREFNIEMLFVLVFKQKKMSAYSWNNNKQLIWTIGFYCRCTRTHNIKSELSTKRTSLVFSSR